MKENPPPKRFLVACSSPFMRLAGHLMALRAWCKRCLPGRWKADVLCPSIVGVRGSMVIRLWPYMIMSTPVPPPPLSHSLLAAELEARERARLLFLQELHARRTRGVESESETLLDFGRVLANEDVEDSRRAALAAGVAASRWVSHVCRELRRNRFAAQRGAMRRNVVPTCGAPSSAVSSLSPPPPLAGGSRAR